MKFFASLLLLVFLSSTACSAQDFKGYSTETVIDGIRVPWGMVWLPSGDLLVSERGGEIYRVRDNAIVATLSGVPTVDVNGQGGLLDLELHPNFAQSGWLYLSYSSPDGEGSGSNTAIMRARLDGDSLVEKQVLYRAKPNSTRGQHYGSRLEFDEDGYLYFSIGDRGDRDHNPQDLSRDGGKIYRLHDDGRIPDNNPFASQSGAIAAIYSYGHRNPQGMARHPDSGAIWIHEHGPRGGDEINLIKAGANYGWPILSYGINYSGTKFAEATEREGYQSPLWYWDPSIAPSGMAFVTSDKYPDWQGRLLVGSLKFDYLALCSLSGESVTDCTPVMKGIGRVRNIRQGPEGDIYVAVEGGQGILRIVKK